MGKRLLVVDDNQVVQEILADFFGGRYDVEVASNASQALSAFVRRAPDVMLLDVRMPGVMDGLGLLRSLREMGVTTPIVVITGYDGDGVAEEAVRGGATAFLSKPVDLLQLDGIVADTVSGAPAQFAR